MMFDCCNSGTMCDFKFNDVKNLILMEHEKKEEIS